VAAPLIDALDEAHFGGKAASLARSLRAGLPVPPGFALGTTDVEALFTGDAEVLKQLRVEFTRLAGPCAVRSSAVGEDSEGASFAGQHVTVLNVRHEDQVGDAVLKVRESAHTDSARAYRRTLGMDETPKVGVVVQRMIEPDCAGVMFTKNPLNGCDERVIEASWGLGEAVVAGLVVPDNYALDREGRVLRQTIGEKDIALRGAPDGGTVAGGAAGGGGGSMGAQAATQPIRTRR
jgi:pyruvate,water dikinase